MGVVFLAQNKLMGRKEVLKLVSRELMDRRGVLDRFLREIRNAAQLHHPNIVTAYSAMRAGQHIVFAMEKDTPQKKPPPSTRVGSASRRPEAFGGFDEPVAEEERGSAGEYEAGPTTAEGAGGRSALARPEAQVRPRVMTASQHNAPWRPGRVAPQG